MLLAYIKQGLPEYLQKNNKMKKLFYIFAVIAMALTACDKNETVIQTEDLNGSTYTQEFANIQHLSSILCTISTNIEIVKEVHQSVEKSLDFGLDETMYIDRVMNASSSSKVKSALSENDTLCSSLKKRLIENAENKSLELLSIDGLEVYWPYSENWDGKSMPVICSVVPDFQYIDGDKVMAYKLSTSDNGEMTIDSLLVDENYAKTHPVWVVKNSEFSLSDLDKIFKSEPTSKGISYIPRSKDVMKTPGRQAVSAATNSIVSETKIESIQSTVQHDDWLNGGSEYVLYWFFPTSSFGIATHQTNQIQMSRSEISNKTIRTLDFDANFDWFNGQEHNRLKIIEFDPGKDMSFEIKLSTSYHEKDKAETITGEFKTTITVNENDDPIMDYTIPRTSMFTVETQQSDGSCKKTFNYSGVNVVVRIRSIQGI